MTLMTRKALTHIKSDTDFIVMKEFMKPKPFLETRAQRNATQRTELNALAKRYIKK
jgi:hypothetical protein